MRRRYPPLAALVAVVITGCGTAPQWQKYEPALAAQFAGASSTQTTADPAADFWLAFDDSELTQLVQDALKTNADIRIARANLAEARANARNSIAQLFPEFGLSGGARRARERDMQGGDASNTNSTFNGGFDAYWEAELFGRVAKDVKIATDASQAASEALIGAARITIAGEVTRNYLELRGLQAQRVTAQRGADNLREAAKLIASRRDAGRATALDTERASADLAGAEAVIPAVDAAINRAMLRLGVLTGATPTALATKLSLAKPLPGAKAMELAHVGTPAALLLRRPDVKAAEQQAWVAAARVGIARSQLVPRITLSGTLGLNSGRVQDLGNAHTFIYNLGANIAWTFFDFGRRQSAIDAASARRDVAVINYERVVIAALEETEDALATYTQMQRQTDRLFAASEAANKAAAIARARLDAGASDAVALLNAERDALAARNRFQQSQTQAATALVAVYKALAGGVSEQCSTRAPVSGQQEC